MTSHHVQLLFVDLALILLLARGLAALAARLRQPPVVGEIFAGILLGPTLAGGAIADTFFPGEIRPLLMALANVGVALFMFTVGLEVEYRTLRSRGRVAAGTALGSTIVPFVLGLGVALALVPRHDPDNPAAFVVFLGLAISITAFPVLARILTDRGLSQTMVGGIALAAAAAVDVVAWTALAAVQATVGGGDGNWRVLLMLPYVALMMLLVRPLLRRFLTRTGANTPLSMLGLVVALSGALLSAAATEAMGLHFIFGAFLFGLVMPGDVTDALRVDLIQRTGQFTTFLLPVYFVVAGLQVNLGGMGVAEVLEFAAILLVAVVAKVGGTYLGARTQGLPKRPAAALATLMNTRGLTELIVLGVGLSIGVLDSSLYSLMVVMAVVTTAMTGPILSVIYRKPVELSPDAVVREIPRQRQTSSAA